MKSVSGYCPPLRIFYPTDWPSAPVSISGTATPAIWYSVFASISLRACSGDLVCSM